MVKFRVAKRIALVHPLAVSLAILREVERRMLFLGVSFPCLYVEVSDQIALIEPLVEGTPLKYMPPVGGRESSR